MVTQKRLGIVNRSGFELAFVAILTLIAAMLVATWISAAQSSGSTTQPQTAPSSAPSYQGHVRQLHPF